MNRHFIEEETHRARRTRGDATLVSIQDSANQATMGRDSFSAGILDPRGRGSPTQMVFSNLGGLAHWTLWGLWFVFPQLPSHLKPEWYSCSLPSCLHRGGGPGDIHQITLSQADPPICSHSQHLPSVLLPGLSLANGAMRISSNRKSGHFIL